MGWYVEIDHGAGTRTRLGHLSAYAIPESGARVEAGQVIGRSGGARGAPGAGNSGGPHVHEERIVGGRHVNPGGNGRRFRTDANATDDDAERAAQRAANELERLLEWRAREGEQFQHQLAGLHLQLLDAERDQVRGVRELAEFEVDQLTAERDRLNQRFRDEAADRTRRDEANAALYRAQAEQLVAANDRVYAQRVANRRLRELDQLHQQQVESQRRGAEYDLQLLRMQADLATTAAERSRIAGEILAIEQRQRRQALEDARRRPGGTPEEIASAQLELARLPALEQGERAQLKRQSQGPGARYRSELEADLAAVNDRLEELQVRAIRELEDELAGAAARALGLRGALGDIVTELMRIGIQRQLTLPIADALFGPDAGKRRSGAGGLFAGILGLAGGLAGGGGGAAGKPGLAGKGSAALHHLLPGFDSGALLDVGGVAGIDRNLVSLNGHPAFRVSRGEKLAVIPSRMPGIPRSALQRAPASLENGELRVRVEGSEMLKVHVERVAGRAVAAAAPGIAAAAGQEMVRRLRRPRIPG
jgi:hypothetical protein